MIKFISIDSSLANTGIAVGTIEADGNITVETIHLHETKPDKSKKIRASSDAIARCKSTYGKVKTLINTHKPKVIFVLPTSIAKSIFWILAEIENISYFLCVYSNWPSGHVRVNSPKLCPRPLNSSKRNGRKTY